MKKISITILVLITLFLTGFCFFCSAQTLQQVYNHSGLTPTINANNKSLYIYNLSSFDMAVKEDITKQNSGISIYPAYFNSNNTQFITDSTMMASDLTAGAGYISALAYTNTTPFNYFLHTFLLTPFYLKIQANHFDSEPVKFVMHPPTMESLTITDLAVWDNDTLKKVHLATPLTVEGFKTLITKK